MKSQTCSPLHVKFSTFNKCLCGDYKLYPFPATFWQLCWEKIAEGRLLLFIPFFSSLAHSCALCFSFHSCVVSSFARSRCSIIVVLISAWGCVSEQYFEYVDVLCFNWESACVCVCLCVFPTWWSQSIWQSKLRQKKSDRLHRLLGKNADIHYCAWTCVCFSFIPSHLRSLRREWNVRPAFNKEERYALLYSRRA